MNIVFPELNNPTIQTAISTYNEQATRFNFPLINPISAPDLDSACTLVKTGKADTLIAGIDYSSRDIILACREHFTMTSFADSLNDYDDLLGIPISQTPYTTFSGLAVMQRNNELYLLADVAACKHPTRTQLIEIVQQTYTSAKAILPTEPKIALLSFSSFGSGGHDDTIDLLQSVLTEFDGSNILIDGEMQLDTAINPTVAGRKSTNSPVAGHANVLIAPDLNSGNLVYKTFEQIAGFTVAGPIIQGFEVPVSDLSRGSTAEDVLFTIKTLAQLFHH